MINEDILICIQRVTVEKHMQMLKKFDDCGHFISLALKDTETKHDRSVV